MDGDLGSLLSSVMSDPEQMAKLTAAAQSLMGSMDSGASAPSEPPEPAPMPGGGGDSKLLAALGQALGGGMPGKTSSRSTALLGAMRPYMRPEKQEKLDRAMQIARMVHVAGVVLGQMKGDDHGL